jgi:hypothetical protein
MYGGIFTVQNFHMNILSLHQYLAEGINFKPTIDFKKTSSYILSEYKFVFESFNYIVEITANKIMGSDYYISIDIKTKEHGFNLVPIAEPFKLSAAVMDIVIDFMQKFSESANDSGIYATKIRQTYLTEPNEVKNIRALMFNRPIRAALGKLKIPFTENSGKPRFGDGYQTDFTFSPYPTEKAT